MWQSLIIKQVRQWIVPNFEIFAAKLFNIFWPNIPPQRWHNLIFNLHIKVEPLMNVSIWSIFVIWNGFFNFSLSLIAYLVCVSLNVLFGEIDKLLSYLTQLNGCFIIVCAGSRKIYRCNEGRNWSSLDLDNLVYLFNYSYRKLDSIRNKIAKLKNTT